MQDRLEAEVRRGHKADEAWRSLEDRFDEIYQNLLVKWSSTLVNENEAREQVFMMVHALKELQRSYFNEMKTGKLARAQLEKRRG